MNDELNKDDSPPPSTPRRRRRPWLWLPALAAVLLAGYALWRYAPLPRPWAELESSAATAETAEDRLEAVEQALSALQREQRQLSRGQGDNAAALRVLREELFGIRDRAALLEQTLERTTTQATHADQALRLDEAELLLGIGAQRLALADDLASAIHAYSLAAGSLAQLDDPAYLDLRRTVEQELATLRTLPADPAARAAGELDAFEAALADLPIRAEPLSGEQAESRLARAFGRIVQVRPASDDILLRAEDRAAGETALALQLTLARLALTRRDQDEFGHALTRAERWLRRLHTESPAREALIARLATLRTLPLHREAPTLGNALRQLRLLRQGPPLAPRDPPEAAVASPQQ